MRRGRLYVTGETLFILLSWKCRPREFAGWKWEGSLAAGRDRASDQV